MSSTGFAPWTARGPEIRDVDREFLVRVVMMHDQPDAPAVEARLARRIAASLNACAEISTEGLERVAREGGTLRLALEATLAAGERPVPPATRELVAGVAEFFTEQDAEQAARIIPFGPVRRRHSEYIRIVPVEQIEDEGDVRT